VPVIGYEDHGGPNQRVIVLLFVDCCDLTPSGILRLNLQWTFDNTDSGWTIKSAGSGKYIGIEGDPNDGTPLIAVDEPVVWNIWPDERDKSHFRYVCCYTYKHT
jgi:hypothetical protein